MVPSPHPPPTWSPTRTDRPLRIPFMPRPGLRHASAALLVGTLTFLLAGTLVWMVEGDRRAAERDRVEFLARDHARLLEAEIGRALTVSHALEALLRQGNGEIADFDRVATEMLDYHPAISVLALSPGGVIRQTAPFEENRASIGFDQFADPVQGVEARLARDSGALTLAGPLELVQGGLGVVGRLPVFLEGPDESEAFWGLVNVVLRIPLLLQGAGLDRMEQLGLDHLLWRVDPRTGAIEVISSYHGDPEARLDPVSFPIELPNGTWYLSSAPLEGWAPPGFLRAGMAGSLLLGLLLGWLTWLLLALRSHRTQLEAQVAHRTRQIEEARSQLKATLDAVPDLLFEVDADGVYRDFHSPRRDLLAAQPDAILGRSFTEFVPPEAVETIFRALEDAEENGWSSGYPYALELEDGTHWFELSVSRKPVPPGDRPRYIVLARDITDRKASDAALRESEARYFQAQKLESVGRLAAGVAHDFNNLLTVIQGSAEEVRVGLPPGHPARAEIRHLQEAADRGASLTRQLLGYSRRQVLLRRPLEVNGFLREMEGLLSRVLGEDVRLELALSREALWTEGDSTHLTQVLMNLAGNARDAMPRGGTLRIETRAESVDAPDRVGELEREAGSRWVHVAVTDTGTGMEPGVQERIFEPFYTTKMTGEGSGLGLATVQGIIRQGGGEVTCASAPGEGTTFHLRLAALPPEGIPVPPPDPPRAGLVPDTPDATGPGAPEQAGSGPTPEEVAQGGIPSKEKRVEGSKDNGLSPLPHILVVEDEPAILRLVSRVLQGKGYQVTAFPHPQAALAAVGGLHPPPALLVSDIVMPGMDGVELARRLSALLPGLGVILVSGYTNHALLENGRLPGGAVFLPKPYAMAELTEAVGRALGAAP